MKYFPFRHSYVVCMFKVVAFFDNVKITLYFGTFELRTGITFQKHNFVVTFVRNQRIAKICNYYIIC